MGLLDVLTPSDSDFLKVHAAEIRALKAKCNELEGLITGTLLYVAKTVTSLAYAMTQLDYFILADATDGAALYLLPNPADLLVGMEYKVKKFDQTENAITLQAYGATTIDGAAFVTLTLSGEVVTFVTDGTNLWTT